VFLLGGTVVTSATDLTNASYCEFAFLRALDAKLGRIDRVDEKPDPMLQRAGKLGDEHEARVLAEYRDEFGAGVVEIERPGRLTTESLEAAAAATAEAFTARADVVFQATFFDGTFVGFADFIVHLGDGIYEVQDTKLARSARVTALLQLAAYGEQLERIGVTTGETVRLVLGDRTESEHRLADILPVYRNRRARLQQIIAERLADTNPVAWGDPRYTICGRCDTCSAEVDEHRDVLLVAGMRLVQRARLFDAGITTIDALAESSGSVPGIADATIAGMRRQAQLQVRPHPEGSPPEIELFFPGALAVLPAPDAGDIFFDFEGDPLYLEASRSAAPQWGIDYLFGVVETDDTFVPFWAHSLAEERQAFVDFLTYVEVRRAQYPRMHIYHYAPYERTHLLSLAARHGVGEEAVDGLLRDNVLVDLYPLVRASLRVGSRSYSLKKLEPLYMGSDLRESDVTTAGDSITAYAESRVLAANGDTAESQRILDEIADYNRYDCVSTFRLRDWLLALAAEKGVYPGTITSLQKELDLGEPSLLHEQLRELAGDPLDAQRSDDSTALALAAAAIDYHRRENKSFWWEHFARLVNPLEDWADTRDVFVVDKARVERDWHREGRQRLDRRHLRLRGQLAPGSGLKAGDSPFVVYEYPGPFTVPGADPGSRPYTTARVLEIFDDGDILLEETYPADAAPHQTIPSALVPSPPPSPGTQVAAIAEWGAAIVAAAHSTRADGERNWPVDAVVDILRRVPPRTRSGRLAENPDPVAAVIASLLDLDSSYLAVQGPPGTGKTYLASHVITALVRDHGWRVGVVAQSHAVVDNVLDRIVDAGLSRSLVGKAAKAGSGPVSYTALKSGEQAAFASRNAVSGYVLGGTAWTFSNANQVPRHSLDLLVIDEAGQFSLGYTIAASVAARNLLLLGDPQQLPQVSQGTHPEPINQSALGWISAGHDVLPTELGYFLAESRRMHEAVTLPVSTLSYEGALRSHPSAGKRWLAGIEPGLHVEHVEHVDNATSSIEEAARIVELVRDVLGRAWTNPSDDRVSDPLTDRDIIVVTPYNAQVGVVVEALDAAGFGDVRVGTVDKFQGQEAVVSIVTLAASSPADVPRGMPFLIMKNRLNVAISRAQWASFLVYSPALVDYLPATAAELAQLSAFITLTTPAAAVPAGTLEG